jgi:EPS-associated MarR family transcriptional regulator
MFNIEHNTNKLMANTFKRVNPDIHFKVLHILEENPDTTQRELAKKLGISLGAVNFCLRALIEIGHVKINNFKINSSKSSYLYLLTPKGLSQKAMLTTSFLKRKINEYEALKVEIETISLKMKHPNNILAGKHIDNGD